MHTHTNINTDIRQRVHILQMIFPLIFANFSFHSVEIRVIFHAYQSQRWSFSYLRICYVNTQFSQQQQKTHTHTFSSIQNIFGKYSSVNTFSNHIFEIWILKVKCQRIDMKSVAFHFVLHSLWKCSCLLNS